MRPMIAICSINKDLILNSVDAFPAGNVLGFVLLSKAMSKQNKWNLFLVVELLSAARLIKHFWLSSIYL